MAINSLQIIIIITAFGIVRSLFVSSIPLEERKLPTFYFVFDGLLEMTNTFFGVEFKM